MHYVLVFDEQALSNFKLVVIEYLTRFSALYPTCSLDSLFHNHQWEIYYSLPSLTAKSFKQKNDQEQVNNI